MNSAKAERLLVSMIELESPSSHEAPLGDFLVGELARLGFEARLDEVGNVIAERGFGPTLLLVGHLDTVPPAGAPRVDSAFVHGRGAVDAKGPLAAGIAAAARLPIDAARVVIAAVVEEETPASRGAMWLLESEPPDALVVLEPSGWDGVVLGYKGAVELFLELTRPASHPSAPAEKAVEVAVDAWLRVRALVSPDNDRGAFWTTSATLRRIVADDATAEVAISCRIPPGIDPGALARKLAAAAAVETRVVAQVPGVVADRSNAVACGLSHGIRARGGTPRPKLKTGTTDLNVLATRWNVPMAAYGPGDARLDHTDDERLELAEFQRAIDVLAVALPEISSRLDAADPHDEQRVVEARLAQLGYLG